MSTSDADFDALPATVCEVIWVWTILQKFGLAPKIATIIFENSSVSISWTDTVHSWRNVINVGIKYHYVKESVFNKIFEVRYTPTDKNRADRLT